MKDLIHIGNTVSVKSCLLKSLFMVNKVMA